MKDSVNIAITSGDPAGIGPEIVIKTLISQKIPNITYSVFIAEAVLERLLHLYMPSPKIPNHVNIIDITPDIDIPDLGVQNSNGGEISFQNVIHAHKMVEAGEADAIVTAPISKYAWSLAGHDYPGHTELLAKLSGTDDFGMAFKNGKYLLLLNSTHLAIKDLYRTITVDNLSKKIRMARSFLDGQGINEPVWVLALNAHAGENGRIGSEESIIQEAIDICKGEGINCTGPLVPDAFIARWAEKPSGMLLAMYHDQGLIPFKMLSRGKGVNFTIGLPFVRTSPDHGTAYDIAPKFIADPGSMIASVNLAYDMINSKDVNNR